MRDQCTNSLRWYCRGLGLVFAIAFWSWGAQALGLVGERGMLPIAAWIADAAPWTSFALSSSDGAISAWAWVGALAGLSAAAGLVQAPALALCVWLYASVIVAGQEFMTFQWDLLLIECGVIGVVVCPWSWRDKAGWLGPQPVASVWILRWLLWRLMFQSGFVKLASGDPTWRDLSALEHHFRTQPLPNPLSWYADAMPSALLKLGTAATLTIELVLAFAVFLPGRWRRLAFWPCVALQLAILATGNYGFFNILTLLLCLSLVTDDDWRRWLKSAWLARVAIFPANKPPYALRRRAVTVFLAFVMLLGGFQTLQMIAPGAVPSALTGLIAKVRPAMIVNRYGLFAVMTTTRREIEIEASLDGKDWRPYVFKYKPGPLERTPPLLVGHMPRLDWQMWFAALGRPNDQRWLRGLLAGLLTGSPEILALMQDAPYPSPPRYVRAQFYRYEFTGFDDLRQRGLIWRREFERPYVNPVELRR
jgi:hypothetical protein